MNDWENYSYVETPYEAAARYLDKAMLQVDYARSLKCMKETPELRRELDTLYEELRQRRLRYMPEPTAGWPRFGKLEAT